MWAIIIYGALGLLAWNANGPWGAVIVLVIAGTIHFWITRPPTFDNGKKTPAPLQPPGIGSKIGEMLGGFFGLIILAAIGLSILSALLSPGSCSSGAFEQEYRAP